MQAKRSCLIITVVLSNNSIDLTLLIQDVIKYQKSAFRLHKTLLKPNVGFQMGSSTPREAQDESQDAQDESQDARPRGMRGERLNETNWHQAGSKLEPSCN